MLDRLDTIKKIDKGNMLGLIYNFPDHCKEAIEIARQST